MRVLLNDLKSGGDRFTGAGDSDKAGSLVGADISHERWCYGSARAGAVTSTAQRSNADLAPGLAIRMLSNVLG
jgi:hypothetical protein